MSISQNIFLSVTPTQENNHFLWTSNTPPPTTNLTIYSSGFCCGWGGGMFLCNIGLVGFLFWTQFSGLYWHLHHTIIQVIHQVSNFEHLAEQTECPRITNSSQAPGPRYLKLLVCLFRGHWTILADWPGACWVPDRQAHQTFIAFLLLWC